MAASEGQKAIFTAEMVAQRKGTVATKWGLSYLLGTEGRWGVSLGLKGRC